MTYRPPVEDLIAAMRGTHAADAFDEDLARAVLTEAGQIAEKHFSAVNQQGDRTGARLTETGVTAAPGFSEAYAAYAGGGWLSLPFPEAYGGQELPRSLAVAVMEMMQGANSALSLCPLLSLGAIEALLAHGDDEQKRLYLPKLISGEWTGTMNLTEPQAGSDVGALTTKAVPNGDGTYAVTGQKIFITWGDHDMVPNIVHLVLARLPDAPPGSKGISLFLCPKFLLDENGEPAVRNAVNCIALESKIGIHASPTCVMEYSGATATLIGAPNKGLAAMFTMMNSARLNVGIQGVGWAEAAFQIALDYARERKQGAAPGVEGHAPIIAHPDVFRMLATMKAKVMAARAICYACAAAADAGDEAREGLLTPIAKAWSTDAGVDAANLGVQVHGGMGFMNETGAAQTYRDARIGPIYEGTNGIQAMDLVGRKLADGGAEMLELLDEARETVKLAQASNHPDLVSAAEGLAPAIEQLAAMTGWLVETNKSDREQVLYAATRYQALAGCVTGAHYLVRIALGTGADGDKALANYFVQDALPAPSLDAGQMKRASEAVRRLRETAAWI
ncbi:MAG: acyl-CoA dehydrogenase family protein [Hyphomonadaceae bacterium]